MRQLGSHLLRATALVLVPVLVMGLGACKGAVKVGAAGPVRPAPILHLVFFQLENPAEAGELLADCQQFLPSIPGVVAYAAGSHLDVGRESVDGNYDLALLVGFADVAAYQGYLVHPDHLQLLSRWKERISSTTIHDVLDQPPP